MNVFRSAFLCAVALTAAHAFQPLATAAPTAGGYAVVVSRGTYTDPAWRPVVDALEKKHGGSVVVWDAFPTAKFELARTRPRYACFVATPKEAGRDFVAGVHRLSRALDDDPYTDVLWGILTGYDAENALEIARHDEPLEIRKTLSGTDVALEMLEEGVWYSELDRGRIVRKAAGEIKETQGPADSTSSIVDEFNQHRPDLFVTSGHATERDWQIGFRYRNGYFRSENGRLYGEDTKKNRHAVDSPNPKVYLAVGNCLMGHIDGDKAMALAYLKSAGVRQMVGYTVETWYGYGGWGMLDYFVEQPGRFTLAEAFFANHQALLHKLETEHPADARRENGLNYKNGLLYDRDVVAFYGDPAWEARVKPAPCAWDQILTEEGGLYTLTITPKLGDKSFRPVNTNGSQRGGRPIVQFLPRRLGEVELVSGADLKPVITENFVLVPLPTGEVANEYRVQFKAKAAE